MALSLRQSYLGAATTVDPTVTSVVVVTGDYIIVAWDGNQASNGTTAGSVSDNASGGTNTYSEVTRKTILVPPAATSSAGHVWVAVAKASETLTITCARPASEVDNRAVCHVVQGGTCTLAQVVDQFNSKNDASAGTAHTGASITTTNAADYLFSFWFNGDNATTLTENGGGFTKRQEDSNHELASFDQVVAATGNYADIVTSDVSTILGNIVASFRQDPAAAGTAGHGMLFGGIRNTQLGALN